MPGQIVEGTLPAGWSGRDCRPVVIDLSLADRNGSAGLAAFDGLGVALRFGDLELADDASALP